MNSRNIYNITSRHPNVVNILINYFRCLAQSHIEIKAFTTGMQYDIEEIEGNHFPLLQFLFPITSTNSFVNGNDLLTITFDLIVYNGGYIDCNGLEHNIAPDLINEVRIQNTIGDLVILDDIEDRAFRILNSIVTKLNSDLQKHKALPTFKDVPKNALKGAQISNDITIVTERLSTSSLLSSSRCTVSITFNNPYICNLDEIFSNCPDCN